MNKYPKKIAVTVFATVGITWLPAYAESDHDHGEHTDHDGDHGHEHHAQYLADGAIDIALVYHTDHSELAFTLFAGEDHGHDHDHDGEHDHDGGHDHDHGAGIDPEDAVIVGGADTKFVLRDGGDFDFLGEAGDEFYRLPQDAAAGPAAPGFAMEFAEGIFTDDEASIELTGFEGPGDLVAFILDGFGEVTIVFDTRDGLDASDAFAARSETHQHLNWAFSEPGIYHLDLEGHAELVADSADLTTSGELKIQVGSGAAYLREIESYENGWAMSERLGAVYAESFPWLFMPLLDGWTYASGEGGDAMFLFAESSGSWLYTGVELAPWFYDFEKEVWIFVTEREDGTVWSYNASTGIWSSMR